MSFQRRAFRDGHLQAGECNLHRELSPKLNLRQTCLAVVKKNVLKTQNPKHKPTLQNLLTC